MWTGVIRTADCDAYREYLEQTGLREYRETPGNLEAIALYRALDADRTEVVTISKWISRESIVAFAGEDISKAVYYPEDEGYLLAHDDTVKHYDIVE